MEDSLSTADCKNLFKILLENSQNGIYRMKTHHTIGFRGFNTAPINKLPLLIEDENNRPHRD